MSFPYKGVLLFLATFSTQLLMAQDDLLAGLEPEPTKEFVTATFKGTRLINFQTVEVPGRRSLDFRISHRFGDLNGGLYDFFGFDGGATIRFAFEYSYDGRLSAGIGRTSQEKMLDGFLKYRLVRQAENGGWPISITLFSSMYSTLLKDATKATTGIDKYERVTNRLSYANQIIIGRKFSDRFSVQVAPVYLHYNLVDNISDKNDAIVITAATRFKFTKRSAITIEYGWRATQYSRSKYYDSLGIGYEVETGGHVFQLFLTNSRGILENQFLTHTNTSWQNMGIRFGFNISRVFTL